MASFTLIYRHYNCRFKTYEGRNKCTGTLTWHLGTFTPGQPPSCDQDKVAAEKRLFRNELRDKCAPVSNFKQIYDQTALK